MICLWFILGSLTGALISFSVWLITAMEIIYKE